MKHTTRRTLNATIHETFDLQGATPFGGANLLLDYSRTIRLDRKLLEEVESFEKRPNAVYPLHQVLEYLIAGRVLGCTRICSFDLTEVDPLLRTKFDQEKLPDPTLLYYDLERFDTDGKREALHRTSLWTARRVFRSGIILDIDTSVATVHGHLEGSAVGYNPQKRGRPSFQPILAFDGVSRASLRVELRPGNISAGTDTVAFLERVLSALPQGTPIQGARLDKGFQGERIFTFFEDKAIPYAIKMKVTRPLRDYADRHMCFRPIGEVDGDILEVGVGYYRASTWTKARRVVVVRKCQLGLFDAAYDYQTIVTTHNWDPEDVFHFYNHRCTQETMIREGKEGFGFDQFSSMSFDANYADLLVKAIVYNLSLAFQRDLMPYEGRHWTVQSLRRCVFIVPAVLSRHARQWTLHMASQFAEFARYPDMRRRLMALRC